MIKNQVNKKELHDRVGWILLVGFIILILSEALGSIILPEISIKNGYLYTFTQYISFIFLWLVVMVTVLVFRKNRYIKNYITSQSKGNKISYLFLGLLVGFLLNGFCAAVAVIHGDFKIEYSTFELIPVMGLFLAVFVQSSAEEVLCRGFLYQRLLKSTSSPWFTIIGNSLFFAILHLLNDGITFLAFYDLFITGVLFSLVVYYFDSLWMAMGIHATWNFTQSIILGLPNSGASFPYSIFKLGSSPINENFAYDKGFGLEGTILSSVLISLVCVFIYFWKDKRKVNVIDFEK